MRDIPGDRIRNIGFMAHIDAGKTTTTERILFYTGVTYKMGEVHNGTAVMDWMDQEKERGITITSAATTCRWKDFQINIIDTPGHVDFTAEVERSFRVLDGAIIVLCGVGGIEPQTEKVWFQASKYNIPRIIYINKMDRIGSDYIEAINQIEDKFNTPTLLLQLPVGSEDSFEGIIDLISMKVFKFNGELLGSSYEIVDIPEDLREEAEVHREHLVEKLADMDMELMEDFLDKKPISNELIKSAVRRITLDLNAVPVIMGSSFKNKGVQNLLDAIVDYLPSPHDKGEVSGYSVRKKDRISRKLSDDESFLALIFKILSDPYMGQLIYFRVYSGSLKTGSMVFNSTKGKKLRVQRLLKMHSNKREDIKEIFSGDIAATVGIDDISTGDTLCDERNQIILETINFPEPVIKATIEPKLTSDHTKLENILNKLTTEDPTFKYYIDKSTGQKIVAGMGELHIEVIRERMKREFGIKTKMGTPRVAYKETIRKRAVFEEKYIKQSGGKSLFAHIELEILPFPGKEKFKFINKLKSNVIPQEYTKAVELGVREAMDIGVIAGYPITNIEVNLTKAIYDEEDSSEASFKIAASNAFTEAFKKANPILLEPIMKIEVLVQDEYLGEVIGDFNSREGKVTKMDVRNNLHIIDGFVPLANMFGYATALRTLSQGRANYSMEFFSYVEMNEQKMTEVLRNQLGIYNIN